MNCKIEEKMLSLKRGGKMKKKNTAFIVAIILFIIILSILVINYLTTPKEGSLIELSYKNITTKIEKEENFILVISKSTCSHCATYKPKLVNITKEYGIDIFYIDIDKESEEKQKEFLSNFNLSGATPTTIFIKDGKETSVMDRLEGDLSESKVLEKFKKMGFIEK